MRRTAWFLSALLVLAACSGESESDATPTTASTQSTTAAPATTAPPAPATEAPATTSSTTVAPATPASLAALTAAAPEAAVLAVTVNGTARPSFTWDAATEANRYLAIVVDEAGVVLWSWAGDALNVTVGAGEVDRAGAGARLVRPGWLQVVAYGEQGIVALSEAIPVG